MEFLEKLGDWFNLITAWVERRITRIFGSANERRIRKIGFVRDNQGNDRVVPGSVLERINQFEPEMQKLSDEELEQSAETFRRRLADGETLDDLLPEAFAAVREAGRRYLGMRHYDVQMVGGYALHHGTIAEMVTGEGKTLVATLAAFLNALQGPVHIITVNDYLARRDMEWMAPLYTGLGLTIGAIQSNMDPRERQKAYTCDIVYGTNNEFGFDYLRDNMKPTRDLQVQGPLHYAIVDEIDNILIDEARTPLIISGPAHDDVSKYPKADRIARQLEKGVHFEVKEKEHSVNLTEEGIRYAERLAGVESFYTAGNMEWPHLIDNALKAHHLYKRDANYVVENGEVVIVDEFTGRKMPGRQWSDGLHQAVESKEGVKVKAENQTFATITLQNFFKLYDKLAGMTGTAMTESEEFYKIYKLDVLSVPTNKPLHRYNYPDRIYRTENEKWDAVVEEIREIHNTGRPILVGTVSIEKSELLSKKLTRYGIKHDVLNAKHHEREAEIIAQAGRKGAVTIATNMAGRGTDIILGGNPEHMAWEELRHKHTSRIDVPKKEWDELTQRIADREGMYAEGREVARIGGLHVIGTERHDARRVDLQLRGRSGRQGDPGSSRFFVSLEDDLLRIFGGEWVKNMLTRMGMEEGESIESRMVTKRVEGAQRKREEHNFDIRKHLLEYDEVMDDQRKRVYSFRQRILDGANCRQIILDMIERQIENHTRHFLDPDYRWETIAGWAGYHFHIEIEPRNIRDMPRDQLEQYLDDEARAQAEELLAEQFEENLPGDMDPGDWNWQALSKWANVHYGLNTNDRELKKIGREGIQDHLRDRIFEAVDRYDYSDLDHFLAEDMERRSLCGWLYQHFTLEVDPDEIADMSVEETIEFLMDKVHEAYREKEILFPVTVGMTNFLSDRTHSERQNREALAKWAGDRFEKTVPSDELRGKPLSDVETVLADYSRSYLLDGEVLNELDERLDRVYGPGDGPPHHEGNGQALESPDQLVEWANRQFHSRLTPENFDGLSREEARQTLLNEFDRRYRPELAHAERALLLEVLDSAWKEHLYYMDHLRSGIGLVGYAQKDPKVEYKREGRKAFLSMWERVDQQVSSAIFRLERESQAFVGSLWQVTSATHEEADASSYYPDESGHMESGGGTEPGEGGTAVATIRNTQPKVGRNDPCPCGSGKKYKKCCGKAA